MTDIKEKVKKINRLKLTTDERLLMLENDYKAQIKEVKSIESFVNRRDKLLTAKMSEANKRLDRFEPHLVEKHLDSLEEKVTDLNRRVQAMILRHVVLTEVCYAVRKEAPEHVNKIQGSILDMFDNDDAWWYERREMTIGGWTKLAATS